MGYTHGIKWTRETVTDGIKKAMNTLGIDRMPTRTELVSIGENGLACNISKKYGWYELADELGLKMKDSETTLGKKYENIVAKKIESLGFEVDEMAQNYPYDLLINKTIKVDVKSSHMYEGNDGNFYSFRMGKEYATCDVYILVAINKSDEVYYIVPSASVIQNKQISIGQYSSMYERYKDRWDVLGKYISYMDELKHLI